LYILFEKQDPNGTGQTANEEFASALMKNGIHLSKNDLSQICRYYKVNDLEINYAKFMEEVSPPLTAEREQAVRQLFDLIKEQTNQSENVILYHDLIALCNFKHHPAVQSGQLSLHFAREIIKTTFDSIQNDKDQITFTKFKHYFRGIGSGYPYNTNAFIRFIQSCWGSLFKKVNKGNISIEEANKYVEQIEAMLAEKTRQKVKGSESESNTLLRQFKHFDTVDKSYLNYSQFSRTLESFGVMAPEKELTMMFDKWCVEEKDENNAGPGIKKLYYRKFVKELFKKH